MGGWKQRSSLDSSALEAPSGRNPAAAAALPSFNGLDIGAALLGTVSVSTLQQRATLISWVRMLVCVCSALTMPCKSHSLVSTFRRCTLQTHQTGGLFMGCLCKHIDAGNDHHTRTQM